MKEGCGTSIPSLGTPKREPPCAQLTGSSLNSVPLGFCECMGVNEADLILID
jgi:hypothetical protein